MSEAPAAKQTCFIAMPITTHSNEREVYGDEDHWTHVMEHLFVPAVEKAGFEAVRPTASGTSMIHGRIVRHLAEADIVLCDLSQHNPNVFFELGVRTSLNLPIALVKDEHLSIPFDTSGLNTYKYASSIAAWDLPTEVDALAQHITDSVRESAGKNPMWQHFGVMIAADKPTNTMNPTEARLELISERLGSLENIVRHSNEIETAQITLQRAEAIVQRAAARYMHSVKGLELLQHSNGTGTITVRTSATDADTQNQRIGRMLRMLSDNGIVATVTDSSANHISVRIDTP